MTVTWKLRDGLKWSDGEDLTCDDFRYAWEWVLDPDNVGVVTVGLLGREGLGVPVGDGHGAALRGGLRGLHHHGHRAAASPLPWLDPGRRTGEGRRASGPTRSRPCPPAAPSSSSRSRAGTELRLARNPNYTSWKTGKPARLDGIVFKWYGDPDAMIAGYRGGEVDIATDLQDSDMPKVQDLGDQVSAIQSLTYEFLRPNWSDVDAVDTTKGVGGCSKNPAVTDRGNGCPMADPAMREAVAYAVNKDEINQRLLGGLAQVANTFVSPEAWFYTDQPPVGYDPAKAKEVLEAAGWTDADGDGFREKDGIKARIELCTTTRQVRQDTLALVSAWLKDVGIDTVVNPVDATSIFADYNESTIDTPCVLSHGNFDLALHAFTSSIDPLGNYFSYHSSQFNPDGVNNASVSDPAIDATLDEVRNSVDFTVIRGAMAEFQALYLENTVEVPLYYRKQVDLHAPRIGNFIGNPTQAGPTWNVVDWFAGS